MSVKNEKDENSLDFIQEYKTGAITIVTFVIFAYLLTLPNLTKSFETIGDMGALGDFFGGILNPTFSLLALFALLATIKIQSKALNISSEELKLTRNELSLTRGEIANSTIAQQEQSESLKIQNNSSKQQSLENTFFNMLTLHTDIVKHLSLTKEYKESINDNIDSHAIEYSINVKNNMHSQETITFLENQLNLFFNQYNTLQDYQSNIRYEEGRMGSFIREDISTEYNQMNRTNYLYLLFHEQIHQFIGHYFRNIYQILKYIKESEITNKKFYSNLFRAQFSKNELKFLFYNCVSDIGKEKFLALIIEFEFLEHLPYSEDINKKDILFCIEKTKELNIQYENSKLFGENQDWREQIIQIKSVHEPL